MFSFVGLKMIFVQKLSIDKPRTTVQTPLKLEHWAFYAST